MNDDNLYSEYSSNLRFLQETRMLGAGGGNSKPNPCPNPPPCPADRPYRNGCDCLTPAEHHRMNIVIFIIFPTVFGTLFLAMCIFFQIRKRKMRKVQKITVGNPAEVTNAQSQSLQVSSGMALQEFPQSYPQPMYPYQQSYNQQQLSYQQPYNQQQFLYQQTHHDQQQYSQRQYQNQQRQSHIQGHIRYSQQVVPSR